MEALLGFFHFLEAEEGSGERVGPGQLRQRGGVHGAVLPAAGAAMSNKLASSQRASQQAAVRLET